MRQSPRPEVAAARKLRRTMSLPEVLLWGLLRGGKTGLRFRRQHPIGPYIADFYCPAARLVIEVDGQAHDRALQADHDRRRNAFMEENGYTVLRISAGDAMKAPEEVISLIRSRMVEVSQAADPLHRCAVPLPASGEDSQ